MTRRKALQFEPGQVHPVPRVQDVRSQIDALLCEISGLFVDGVKLTFIARNPFVKDADMVLTSEPELQAAINVLEHMKSGGAA
jgi:hypothetical protein